VGLRDQGLEAFDLALLLLELPGVLLTFDLELAFGDGDPLLKAETCLFVLGLLLVELLREPGDEFGVGVWRPFGELVLDELIELGLKTRERVRDAADSFALEVDHRSHVLGLTERFELRQGANVRPLCGQRGAFPLIPGAWA